MPNQNDPVSLIERKYPHLAAIARGEAGFESMELLWHPDATAEREGMALVLQMARLQQQGVQTDELRRIRGLLSQLGEIGLAIGETLDDAMRSEGDEPSELDEPEEDAEDDNTEPGPTETVDSPHFDHPVVVTEEPSA